MKQLLNIATDTETMSWFADDWQNVQALADRHGFDGLEIFVRPDYPLELIPPSLVTGVHLRYFPIWLDLWRENMPSLLLQFGSTETISHYYGGISKEALVKFYRAEFATAQALSAKYMVFHVAHVELLHTYTRQFTYRDEDVLTASLELIQEVFGYEDKGVTLLFENLWWPGLRLVDYQSTKDFYEQVSYPNKGFVLDVGHLITTNPSIRTEAEACHYLIEKVNALKELRNEIKVVHLNKSLSGAYMQEDHAVKLEEIKKLPTFWDQLSLVRHHICAIDWHMPFDCNEVKTVIDAINPDYLVYELLADSLPQLEEMVLQQKTALR